MNQSAKIHFTRNYEKFQFYPCNRTPSQEHVQNLMDDPSFKEKYEYSPIVVSKDFFIIDGQHRFLACQRLGLPIAHIIDYKATETDIKTRNMLMNNWKGINFLEFYAHQSPDYKLILDLKNKHLIPLTIIFAAIRKICGFRNREFHYIFKKGEMVLSKNREKLVEFVNSYIPAIKYAKTIKGYDPTRPYFTEVIAVGFCHHFLTNRKLYDKALEKMAVSSYPFPFCNTYENARIAVAKLANFREKQV